MYFLQNYVMFKLLKKFNLTLLSLVLGTLSMSSKMVNAQNSNFQTLEKRIFKSNEGGIDLPYRIYVPREKKENLPVVFFLHGRGECGTDNEKQLNNGGNWLLEYAVKKEPAILIYPQCPENSYWSNVKREVDPKTGKIHFEFQEGGVPSEAMKSLQELMRQVLNEKNEFSIDGRRVYLSGLSMGGMGALELAKRNPTIFAAVAAICGGGEMGNPEPLKGTRFWLFHGLKDDVVDPTFSKKVESDLKGLDVRSTFYPDANHNAWDATFQNSQVLKWMFSTHKNQKSNYLINQKLTAKEWMLETRDYTLKIKAAKAGTLAFEYQKNNTRHHSYGLAESYEKTINNALASDTFTKMTVTKGENDLVTYSSTFKNSTILIHENPFSFKIIDHRKQSPFPILEDHTSDPVIQSPGKWVKNFKLANQEIFLGLGEKTGGLNRAGNSFTLWNSDNPGYTGNSDPLYQSIAFYYGAHNGHTYGILLDHSQKSKFNFGAAQDFTSIEVNDDHLVFFFIPGDNLTEIASKYRQLTGCTPLPPKWSLGYHQSRWSYRSKEQIEHVVEGFKTHKLPLDAVHFDIHYMDQNRAFTFDTIKYGNPKMLIQSLQKKGIHPVCIIDPGIQVNSDYSVHESGLKSNVYVKYPSGSLYEASVWPGLCHFPDFSNPSTRTWWGDQMKYYTSMGLDGFWNDMNEPAAWGKDVPEYLVMNREGLTGSMVDCRNAYGSLMALSTRFAAEQQLQKRVFNLTRAGMTGIQRYSAVWTGDNVASDEHLMLSIKLLTSLSISGVDFVGADIGGFMGNASPQLFTRWMTVGAFTPFFRGHKMSDEAMAEPWLYGEKHTDVIRHYMNLRYRLLPYLYSSLRDSLTPIMRPMIFENTWFNQEMIGGRFEHQYYFGKSFLVVPVDSKTEVAEVLLPEINASWYSLAHDEIYHSGHSILVKAPLHQLPVFVKEGSVIPENAAQQIVNTESNSDTINIHIYATINDGNSYFGNLYFDDGISKNSSFCNYQVMSEKGKLQFIKSGSREFPHKRVQLIFHGFMDKQIKLNGKPLKLEPEFHTHFGFDGFIYQAEVYTKLAQPMFKHTVTVKDLSEISLEFGSPNRSKR